MPHIDQQQLISAYEQQRRQPVGVWQLLWMISQLDPEFRTFASNAKGKAYFEEIAVKFNLPLPSYSKEDADLLAQLVGNYFSEGRAVNHNDLLTKMHLFMHQQLRASLSLSIHLDFIKVLRHRIEMLGTADIHPVHHVVVYGQLGLVTAVLAAIEGFKVTYCSLSRLDDVWLAWLAHYLPNFSILAVTDERILEELPKADALILLPPTGNKMTFDDPAAYQSLKDRFQSVIGLHPMNFFMKMGVVAEARKRLFGLEQQAGTDKSRIVSPVKYVITLPAQSLSMSSAAFQLMLVDFTNPGSDMVFADFSHTSSSNSDVVQGVNVIGMMMADHGVTASATQLRVSCETIYKDPMVNMTASSYVVQDQFAQWLKQVINHPHGYSSLNSLAPAQKTSQQVVSDAKEGEGVMLYEIAAGDVDAFGQVAAPTKARHLSSSKALDIHHRFGLKARDLLISVKSTLGKVILLNDQIPDNWIPGMQMLVLRPTPESLTVVDKATGKPMQLTVDYLYHYLRSPMMQAYFQALNSGAKLPQLRLEDVRNIPIPHPSPEQLHQLVSLEQQRKAKLVQIAQMIEAHQHQLEQITDLVSIDPSAQ